MYATEQSERLSAESLAEFRRQQERERKRDQLIVRLLLALAGALFAASAAFWLILTEKL